MIVRKIMAEIAEKMTLPETSGVVIINVKRGSLAAKFGIN